MTAPGKRTVWGVVLGLAVVCLAAGYYVIERGRILRPYHDSFQRDSVAEWKFYGGTWTLQEGVLENLSGARGDRAEVGSTHWSDYVIETDIRLNSDLAGSKWGDSGVVLRVSDPSVGVDAYNGYYVGIGLESNSLFLGRSNYSWNRVSNVPLNAPVRVGSWYRLRVLAKGCYFEANAREIDTGVETRLEYFDRDCTKRTGAVGVRTFSVQASWRNFSVHAP